jgi:hypothetical protein
MFRFADPAFLEHIRSKLARFYWSLAGSSRGRIRDPTGPTLVSDIETALAYDAVGAMRLDDTSLDNFALAYTNHRYMRALDVGWIGARLKNQTFIDFTNPQELSSMSFSPRMERILLGNTMHRPIMA